MTSEESKEMFLDMYKSLTDPEIIKKNIRLEKLKQMKEEKIKDTGL